MQFLALCVLLGSCFLHFVALGSNPHPLNASHFVQLDEAAAIQATASELSQKALAALPSLTPEPLGTMHEVPNPFVIGNGLEPNTASSSGELGGDMQQVLVALHYGL